MKAEYDFFHARPNSYPVQSENSRVPLNREIRNRIGYTVTCVGEFAERYNLQWKDSYLYLKQ